MKQFKPAKSKETYSNGISYKKEEEIKEPISYDEWSIITPTGDLIGFAQIEKDSELPNEIWIRDKKYKIESKIHQD